MPILTGLALFLNSYVCAIVYGDPVVEPLFEDSFLFVEISDGELTFRTKSIGEKHHLSIDGSPFVILGYNQIVRIPKGFKIAKIHGRGYGWEFTKQDEAGIVYGLSALLLDYEKSRDSSVFHRFENTLSLARDGPIQRLPEGPDGKAIYAAPVSYQLKHIAYWALAPIVIIIIFLVVKAKRKNKPMAADNREKGKCAKSDI